MVNSDRPRPGPSHSGSEVPSIRPQPGLSYSESEVPSYTTSAVVVSGRLPILDVDTYVHPPIDDSGRLPPCTSGDNKDGENEKCQPALHKRRRITLIDDRLQREFASEGFQHAKASLTFNEAPPQHQSEKLYWYS